MPEPCPFLNRNLPVCSIIRPTETNGAAMGVVSFLTAMGLFIGQSAAFFEMFWRPGGGQPILAKRGRGLIFSFQKTETERQDASAGAPACSRRGAV